MSATSAPSRAALGIDVGGTHVRAAVDRGSGPELLGSWPLPASYEELVRLVQRVALDGPGAGAVDAVGIGLPGVVRDNRAVWVPNVPHVVDRPLARDVEDALGARAVLANDAQVALLGEARHGAATGRASAALFSLGTGVGGAILVGGRVLRGARGAAGAFGWINVDARRGGDPDHGQLERLASGRALGELARREGAFADGAALVAAARGGDAGALARMAEAGRWLGAAVATVASTLDPEVVLLTGGVSDAYDVLEPAVLEALRALASPTARAVPVRVGALGSRAGVWGAVTLALEGEEAFA